MPGHDIGNTFGASAQRIVYTFGEFDRTPRARKSIRKIRTISTQNRKKSGNRALRTKARFTLESALKMRNSCAIARFLFCGFVVLFMECRKTRYNRRHAHESTARSFILRADEMRPAWHINAGLSVRELIFLSSLYFEIEQTKDAENNRHPV